MPITVALKPMTLKRISFTIRGTSPLIQHQWSEKCKKAIRDKKLGKKTKDRAPTDSAQEFTDAQYRTDDGLPGIPLLAFKSALIHAAHKDRGIDKTLVRKSLFIPTTDSGMVIPMEADDPIMREDYVRVGISGTDLRYRPEFRHWKVRITAVIDAESLQDKDVLTLVNLAGFGVGIGEWRPEKGGENGRFEIDPTVPYESEEL